MSAFLQWFNFIQPSVPLSVLWGARIVGILLVALGIGCVIAQKRADLWIREWLREVRWSAFGYGGTVLLLTWFSSQRVVVLGARVWYVLLAALVAWRTWRLSRRRRHWLQKQKTEQRRMQQLKYKPGR